MVKKRPRNRKRKESLVQKLRRRMAGILKTACFVASLPALFIGGWYVYHLLLASPLLGIQHADVVGAERVSDEEVIALAGIVMGDNLLAVDTGEITRKIKKEPWIEEVRVKRRLPDRVVIQIVERKPVALINLDALYLVDKEGVAFKRYANDDDLDLPIITGFQKEEIEGGGKNALSRVLAFMDTLSEERVFTLEDVSEISVDESYGVALYTVREGVRIEVGWGGFRDKLDQLEKIISLRKGKLAGIEQIDMTGPRGVIVKMSEKVDVQV